MIRLFVWGVFCIIGNSTIALGQTSVWQIQENLIIDFSGSEPKITINNFPGKVYESISTLNIDNNLFVLAGEEFYKNGKLLSDQINGHFSSSQGSMLFNLNDNRTEIYLVSSSFQQTKGLYLSKFDYDSDSFKFLNLELVVKSSELMSAIHLDSNVYVYSVSELGELNIHRISSEGQMLELKQTLFDFPNFNEGQGKMRISTDLRYIGFTFVNLDKVIVYQYDELLNRYCLTFQTDVIDPYSMEFDLDANKLYYSSLGLEMFHLSLDFIEEPQKASINLDKVLSFAKKDLWYVFYRLQDTIVYWVKAKNLADGLNSNIEIDLNKLSINQPLSAISFSEEPVHLAPNALNEITPFCRDTFRLSNPTALLALPNAFSPNNDGLNDCFSLEKSLDDLDITRFEIAIYNHIGDLIFTSNDHSFKFCGLQAKSANSIAYHYVLNYTDQFGTHQLCDTFYEIN